MMKDNIGLIALFLAATFFALVGWANFAHAQFPVTDISDETNLTAGDGITLTDDDLDCDTASGSAFGCLSAANWTTFNSKNGYGWPFTPSSYAGAANQSTTTPFWLNGAQLIASSTLAVNATTTGSSYLGTVLGGTWNGTAIDIGSFTNLTAGDHITLTGDDLDVDDDYILNTGDVGTGSYTFPNASTTNFTASAYASTSKFFADGLVTCNTGNMLTWAAGVFGCEDDTSGAGGGSWPFTPSSYAGTANQSTTTPFWLNGTQLIASSTLAVNASSTMLTNSGSTWLTGLTSALVLAGSDGLLAEYGGIDCTNQFVRDVSAAGAGTCATVGTADASGLDISDDTNLAATYPLLLTGDTLSTAFGTTTANAFSLLNTFANSTSTLGTVTTGWATNWTATYASSTALTVSGTSYLGTVGSGVWNGTAIDIGSFTNLTAGDHITLTGDDLDVDDDFILNTGDVGTGSYTFPNASTTNFTASAYASTSKFFADGLVTCNTENMLTWSGGVFGCESDTAGAGGGSWPFTPSSYSGTANQSTTTPFWLNGTQLIASSTLAVNASSTMLTNSGDTYLSSMTSALLLTGAAGLVAEYGGAGCTNQVVEDISALGASTCVSIESEQLGDDDWGEITITTNAATIDDNIIESEHLGDDDWGDITITTNAAAVEDDSHAHTAATISGLGTADISGLDISDDTNLAATYPLLLTGDTLSTAFGTTTANAFSLLNTFANATSTLFSATTAWIDTLNLTNDLTVANGGTGASTLTGILEGNGTSAVTANDSSTAGQVLRVTGASAFGFGALDLADTDAVTGSLPVANGGTGAASFGGQGWLHVTSSTASPVASTSPTVNYVTATSTTATSTFAGGIAGPGSFKVESSSGRLFAGNPTASIGTAVLGHATQPQVVLSDNSGNNKNWTMRTIGDKFYIASSTASATSTNAVLTIDYTASPGLGVGTSSPWRTVGFVGTGAWTGLTTESGVGNVLCVKTGGEIVQDDSPVTACSGASSRTVKHSITPLENGLDIVLRLKPVSYVYNEDYSSDRTTHLGFIAEDVEPVEPLLIDEGAVKGLKYAEFAAPMVGAIQGLNSKIDNLSIGKVQKSAHDNWQWLALALLAIGLAAQQAQIRRLRKNV